MNLNFFNQLLASEIRERERKSEEWYANLFKELRKTRDFSVEPGSMYTFVYDPKLKKTLPFYDMMPLVVVLDLYNDSFLGLNLHYLPPSERLKFLSVLMETATSERLLNSRKMQITYSILKSASKYSLYKPCIKKYLYTNVRSKFQRITYEYWEHAVVLPSENFAKATKYQVWRESLQRL